MLCFTYSISATGRRIQMYTVDKNKMKDDTVLALSCVSWRYENGSRWKCQKKRRIIRIILCFMYGISATGRRIQMYTVDKNKMKDDTVFTLSCFSWRHEVGSI
jgi:hypothetical protein